MRVRKLMWEQRFITGKEQHIRISCDGSMVKSVYRFRCVSNNIIFGFSTMFNDGF